GEGDRRHAGELAGQARQKAGTETGPLRGGLAGLDVVLRLEMAARQIISAGERYKGDLPLLPQRINRVPQYRVQSPVRIQRDRAVRVGCVGACDRQGRARLVVE